MQRDLLQEREKDRTSFMLYCIQVSYALWDTRRSVQLFPRLEEEAGRGGLGKA